VAFDAWLLAALPAFALAVAFVALRWPFTLDGFDAHGFGASGGEVNALLFPWLHAALWAAALAMVRAKQGRR
jgi:hypothetical protein